MSITNDYKFLLTEERLREALDEAKRVIDQDPDEGYEISLDGYDDLNAHDIQKWADTWCEEQVLTVEGNTIEYHFNEGDEDLIPCIKVWCQQMLSERGKSDCEVCYEKTRSDGCGRDANIGCCDDCHIRVMCKDCGTWDEDDEVWRCPDCQEEHEYEKQEERDNDEPPACQTCKKPCWSNNDGWQIIHGCAVCQDCFDEHEEEHALEKKINLTVGA
jgi:hypothetical protein